MIVRKASLLSLVDIVLGEANLVLVVSDGRSRLLPPDEDVSRVHESETHTRSINLTWLD